MQSAVNRKDVRRVHVLVSAVRDFDLVINKEDIRLVLQPTQPLLGLSDIPWRIGVFGIGRRAKRSSVGVLTIAGVSARSYRRSAQYLLP